MVPTVTLEVAAMATQTASHMEVATVVRPTATAVVEDTVEVDLALAVQVATKCRIWAPI